MHGMTTHYSTHLFNLPAASRGLCLVDELGDAVGQLVHQLVGLALLLGGRGRQGVWVLRQGQPLPRLANARLEVRQHPLAKPQEFVRTLFLPGS